MNTVTNISEDGGYIELIKCELVGNQFRRRGDLQRLTLRDALSKFTPNQRNSVVLKAKPGTFIGTYGSNKECFVISNTNNKGDIGWLLDRKPEFRASIQEVYMIKDMYKAIQKSA